MAQHADIFAPSGAWVKISNGTISGTVRVQNIGNHNAVVQATSDDNAPSGAGQFDGTVRVWMGGGERIDLAEDFGGVSGAAYLWAQGGTTLSVSHA